MSEHQQAVVLRLAGPLQAWGSSSQFNRRDTDDRPTKSGVVGLLAAAQGRARGVPIEDLTALPLGVRVDQPGTSLRDYHTVSDLHGLPLPKATLGAKGQIERTSKKYTHVTQRYYLQDAVFVVAVGGAVSVLDELADALRHPVFPLALGRRSCVPTQPLLLTHNGAPLWPMTVVETLRLVPWQASADHQRRLGGGARIAVTLDAAQGGPGPAPTGQRDQVTDVPTSFGRGQRGMRSREVVHRWIDIGDAGTASEHDPFSLLGW